MAKHRQYDDDDKAEVLAVLQANDGNVNKTARETGVPRATIRKWLSGNGFGKPAESGTAGECQQNKPPAIFENPEIIEKAVRRRGELADEAEEIAWQLLDALPSKIPDGKLQQVATAFGIIVDKVQLLRGLPTGITKLDFSKMSDDDLHRHLETARSRRLAIVGRDGSTSGTGTGGAPREPAVA